MSDAERVMLDLVPRISRARGFRLYGVDGRRYVDLWQYGGAAALGHTASRVLLAFKDTASRGLFAPLPSAAALRLEKALLRLPVGREAVRLYADAESADRALGRAFGASAGAAAALSEPPPYRGFSDPALADPPADSSYALWRPWAPAPAGALPAVLSPVIPLPWPARPIAFLLGAEIADRFPPSDVLSPVTLVAAGRAVDDLVAAIPSRAEVRFRRTDAALSGGAAVWSRRGPYLRLDRSRSPAEYAAFFRMFLDAGFLLPPDAASPAILPLELSAGEDAALALLLCRTPGEIL